MSLLKLIKKLLKKTRTGWIDEMIIDLNQLIKRIQKAQNTRKLLPLFLGNIIDVWEKLYQENIFVDIGSDQTSLHNPFQGGYYPNEISFMQASKMIKDDPSHFKKLVQKSLRKHVEIINKHVKRGTYFFDYGNAFLLEAKRAKANIIDDNGKFIYPSYVQDIMGPLCFDYGFGPFRWICTSNKTTDLEKTDKIAQQVLEKLIKSSGNEIKVQMQDNIDWIKNAKKIN